MVDSTGDQPEFSPGDGSCDVYPPGPPAICTLRAAIQEPNAFPGSDQITFDSNLGTIAPTTRPGCVAAVEAGVGLADQQHARRSLRLGFGERLVEPLDIGRVSRRLLCRVWVRVAEVVTGP